MLDGSETWAMTAEDMRKLARNETSMLRWMCNVNVHTRQSVHWKPSIDGSKVSLTYVSPCGQSGFPGELTITVTYELTDDNCLKVDYMATTTKATPINLTNHAYFNLGGHGIGNLSKHWLIVPAAHYLPVDKNCLVTGEIRPVDGTPMDLRKQVLLSEKFKELPDGYDHTYCFGNLEKKLIALVWHEETERSLKVSSTQPGVHVYTGYFLNGPVGKDGAVYKKYSGLCLETQHYPNSVNEAVPLIGSTGTFDVVSDGVPRRRVFDNAR
uniref:Galactose mutarotase n=1 Tax=Octopus bimaculoides TaxID=37653 RepID=A0A0L8H0W4_OCTBM